MSATLAKLERVGIGYGAAGVRALSDVTLTLNAGERLGIIGESGSGKSTLALALAGLLPPGASLVGRIDWAGTPPRPGRDIGFVFQDPAGSFDPVISIGAQIAEVVRTHADVSRSAAWTRAVALLDAVRLPEPERIARAFPHELSGGQKQRAALAIALAGDPKLLIADEATSALDTVVQAEIVALIDRLVAETGLTLLFITHDIALAGRLSRRVAVLYGGRLVELGAAARVLARPSHPYTRALLSAHLDLDTVGKRAVPTITGAPPDPAAPLAGCRFAPRCPFADATCRVEPAWSGDDRDGFACHHPTGEAAP
jgi:peptide/nickel transport system ATP-binding protein